PGETIPVKDGRLQLGTWQAVMLVELDGPRERRVLVTISPTQDCVLGRSGKREGSARGTHYLHVAAGRAGATILVRPEHVRTPRNACPVVASFAAPAVLAAAPLAPLSPG